MNNNNGFTLIEVIISVSIISLVLVSLFRMQASTIGLAAAGKFNTVAPILAKQLLIEVEADLANWSESQGDFGNNWSGFSWTCKINDSSFETLDYLSEKNQYVLKKIQIEIKGTSKQRFYKIDTWRVAGE